VHHHRVDERGDHNAVDEVGLELRAFGHRTRDDRGRGRGERELKHEEHEQVEVPVRGCAVTEEEALPSDEVVACAERERVADAEERDDARHEVHEVLHHDVGDALRPRHPRLDEGKASLHEDHQHG
jgi:hypothetical protein